MHASPGPLRSAADRAGAALLKNLKALRDRLEVLDERAQADPLLQDLLGLSSDETKTALECIRIASPPISVLSGILKSVAGNGRFR
jgi:hypothetical protein